VAASYPAAIKSFATFADQPGDPNSPDLTIVHAQHLNELHDEVRAIETTLGAAPFVGLPFQSLNRLLLDLRANKAPLVHRHGHSDLGGDAAGNDHPQYARTDGSTAFTAPIGGVAATRGDQLVTWGQAQNAGFLTASQVNSQITAGLLGFLRGVPNGLACTGGFHIEATDPNGNITVWYPGIFRNNPVFVFAKSPVVRNPTPFPPYLPGRDYLKFQAVFPDHAVLHYQQGGQSIYTIQGDVLFPFNQFYLTSDALPVLDDMVRRLQGVPAEQIAINGYTDNIGSFAYNLTLSQNRANSVYNYIVPRVNRGDLSYITTGNSFNNPVAPNQNPDGSDNPNGRAQNRRVTLGFAFGSNPQACINAPWLAVGT
jgi:outer membrane protein OmpA-like peptidoglycan-associated protein